MLTLKIEKVEDENFVCRILTKYINNKSRLIYQPQIINFVLREFYLLSPRLFILRAILQSVLTSLIITNSFERNCILL